MPQTQYSISKHKWFHVGLKKCNPIDKIVMFSLPSDMSFASLMSSHFWDIKLSYRIVTSFLTCSANIYIKKFCYKSVFSLQKKIARHQAYNSFISWILVCDNWQYIEKKEYCEQINFHFFKDSPQINQMNSFSMKENSRIYRIKI
jgi:hypothetical protein